MTGLLADAGGGAPDELVYGLLILWGAGCLSGVAAIICAIVRRGVFTAAAATIAAISSLLLLLVSLNGWHWKVSFGLLVAFIAWPAVLTLFPLIFGLTALVILRLRYRQRKLTV